MASCSLTVQFFGVYNDTALVMHTVKFNWVHTVNTVELGFRTYQRDVCTGISAMHYGVLTHWCGESYHTQLHGAGVAMFSFVADLADLLSGLWSTVY